ncbi:MAG: SEC-C metal-binding domain-containing protein [Pseudomonadota bacterium]
MKKIGSPYYELLLMALWTGAIAWCLQSGMFDTRESVGLVLVWLTMMGLTGYLLVRNLRSRWKVKGGERPVPAGPKRNTTCPCGSGKKYKRCCGAAPAR